MECNEGIFLQDCGGKTIVEIETGAKMTLQELYDIVWKHFVIEKGLASINPHTRLCCYRSPDGAKCAIGVVIPDEIYDPQMENRSIRMLIEGLGSFAAIPSIAKLFEGIPIDTLGDLQYCHDKAAEYSIHHSDFDFHAEIKERLESFSRTYNLQIPSS